MARPRVPMLPFAPLWDELGRLDDRLAGQVLGISREGVQRAKKHGVSVRAADVYATRVGTHPLALWGGAWIEAEDWLVSVSAPGIRERTGWVEIDRSWAQWAAQQERNEDARRGF